MTVRLDIPAARREREQAQREGYEIEIIEHEDRGTKTGMVPFDGEAMDFGRLMFKQPPPRAWVWDGWIMKGRAHYFTGPGGVGKTLLCQLLGTAVVAGVDLFGIPTTQGAVVGVWGEDDHDEIWRRQLAINKRLGCSMQELVDAGACWIPTDRDITMFTAGQESDFATTPEFARFKEMIERRKPALAIIDCVTLVYQGPEGKRQLVTRVMRSLDAVARQNECAIVMIGHNNKVGDFSGSTAFENAVRARLSLERIESEDGGEALRLSLPKANYNGKQSIDLQFSDGVLVAIDEQHMSKSDLLDRNLRRGAAEQKVLDGVDLMTRLERTLSASPRAANYAPKILHPQLHPHDFTVKELESAMVRLVTAGRLEAKVRLPFKRDRRSCEGLGRPVGIVVFGAGDAA